MPVISRETAREAYHAFRKTQRAEDYRDRAEPVIFWRGGHAALWRYGGVVRRLGKPNRVAAGFDALHMAALSGKIYCGRRFCSPEMKAAIRHYLAVFIAAPAPVLP